MSARYCGCCGEGATEADRFCIACGQQLRMPAGPEAAPVERIGAAALAEAGGLTPEHSVLLKHAVNLIAQGQARTALTVLEPLCAEQPDWAIARAYLGVAYLREIRVADARWELEEAVRLAPASFICRSKYGEFLARLGFYDQAMKQMDEALRLHPPDAESKHAAMELRQFCKDKSKGIFYRQTGYPRLSRLVPRRRAHTTPSLQLERGN